MPLYEYEHCGRRFEVLKPISECGNGEICPICGQEAYRVFSPISTIWGWILTERSHHKGAKDQWVKDSPDNENIVYREKAEHIKTIF